MGEFHSVRRLPPYVFEQVNKLKAQARARGEDIIDFGMGNPDMPTPSHIVAKLVETLGRIMSPSCATSVLTKRVKMLGSLGASVPCSAACDL